MAAQTFDARRITRRFATASAIGFNALKPLMQFHHRAWHVVGSAGRSVGFRLLLIELEERARASFKEAMIWRKPNSNCLS